MEIAKDIFYLKNLIHKEITMRNTKKLTLSALFIALGIVLPFFTGQIKHLGNMLLPMHIPVLICGFICGGPCGFIVGLTVPLLRSLLFTMPKMMPTAVAMSVELATYGLVTGILYSKLKTKKFGIYISLLSAMLIGRITWGIASFILYRILGNPFTWEIFAAGAFLNAIPGIIVQLILVPAIIYALKKSQLIDNN
ncbi:MAG: ECF transporter S component [Lachnospiraceae bacterium]|nr:ECF transporter S component [Lachnospiraceae bacterium]